MVESTDGGNELVRPPTGPTKKVKQQPRRGGLAFYLIHAPRQNPYRRVVSVEPERYSP
jgi:hypothetical protein